MRTVSLRFWKLMIGSILSAGSAVTALFLFGLFDEVPDIAPRIWLDAACPTSHWRRADLNIYPDLSSTLRVKVVESDHSPQKSTFVLDSVTKQVEGEISFKLSRKISGPSTECDAVGAAIFPARSREVDADKPFDVKILMNGSKSAAEEFEEIVDAAKSEGGAGIVLIPANQYSKGAHNEAPPPIPFLFQEVPMPPWIHNLGNGKLLAEIRMSIQPNPHKKECHTKDCSAFRTEPGLLRIAFPNRLRLINWEPKIKRDPGRNVLFFEKFDTTVRLEFFDPKHATSSQVATFIVAAFFGLGLALIFDVIFSKGGKLT